MALAADPSLIDSARMEEGWVCSSCHSINRSREKRCYSCHQERGAAEDPRSRAGPPASAPVAVREVPPLGTPLGGAGHQPAEHNPSLIDEARQAIRISAPGQKSVLDLGGAVTMVCPACETPRFGWSSRCRSCGLSFDELASARLLAAASDGRGALARELLRRLPVLIPGLLLGLVLLVVLLVVGVLVRP